MRTKKMIYTSVKSSRSTPAREDLDEMVWIFFVAICDLYPKEWQSPNNKFISELAYL